MSLALVARDAAGVRSHDYPLVVGGRGAGLFCEDVRLPVNAILHDGDALPLIERAVDDATLAACAEAAGVLRWIYRDTVHYARERMQFGVPISSFQVLQHRMADMLMHLEKPSAVTQPTIGMPGEPELVRRLAVSSAKVTVRQACRFIGQNAEQIHGSMDMTDELAIGQFFKRATVLEGLFGPVDRHLRRVDRQAA
ncbi:acyl-CoA dehydrogenase family protein [Noviherbaspirillum pedocola]|uniref:Acyl-CoA dehydrogenase/oxidase C-terminal domain-containing protein n=1 Tax=Noviherbaspirillum pedocola TaxID=2801341 RepID=A0A934SZP8_9BURK|nr:acyl-CoA dehydrogenase family protein [Noviherbaspirillum pedocola]MBK4738697.1 hypothetical protein [Noviherbaspirillum pedocola]